MRESDGDARTKLSPEGLGMVDGVITEFMDESAVRERLTELDITMMLSSSNGRKNRCGSPRRRALIMRNRFISAKAIARMRPGFVLINAARGGMVDEAVIAASLRAGCLGGTALDVFTDEPLSAQRAAVFADVPNLVLTPHIAGVTEEADTRVSWVTVQNVKKALSA